MRLEENYPLRKDLSTYQKKKIDELRQRTATDLAIYPEYNTDFSLLRWLLGYDYDLDQISLKLRPAVSLLKSLNLDQIHPLTAAEANCFVGSLSPAAPYFPGGIMGQDDEGNVIFIQNIARAEPRKLVKTGAVSEFFRASLSQTEMCFKLVRKSEETTGRKLGLKIIIDLEGFQMDLLYPPTLKIYKILLEMVQDTFPDLARKIYVINTPLMIKAVFALISPVLSRKTKEKVIFLGHNWPEVLAADLGSHNIYPYWHGTKLHSLPTGDIRTGGPVPDELLYNSKNEEIELKILKVSSKRREQVMVIGEKGKQILWWWKVATGEVSFWIEQDGSLLWPKFRLSTEFHPERGQFICQQSGIHLFCFESTGGIWSSKEVKYCIWSE